MFNSTSPNLPPKLDHLKFASSARFINYPIEAWDHAAWSHLKRLLHSEGWKDYRGRKCCAHCAVPVNCNGPEQGDPDQWVIPESALKFEGDRYKGPNARILHLKCLQEWRRENLAAIAEEERVEAVRTGGFLMQTGVNSWTTHYGPPPGPGKAIVADMQRVLNREAHLLHRCHLEAARDTFVRGWRSVNITDKNKEQLLIACPQWHPVINDFGKGKQMDTEWIGWKKQSCG